MNRISGVNLCFCIGLALLCPLSAQGKMIVGWVEEARILPGDLLFDAKLDTGADHSSIPVNSVERFTVGETRWVRFVVLTDKAEKVVFERKVIRRARIKRSTVDDIRLVVRMGLCVGPVYKEVDVNLADRSRLKQPILIGRSFLKKNFIVDASVTHTVTPQCDIPPTK